MKSKLFLFEIALLFLLVGCSKDFLKVYPETSLNEGNFYTSDNEFVSLVSGCYVPLRNAERWDHWVMSELKSDNLDQQFSAIAGNFETAYMDNLLTGAASITVQNYWDISYQGVYRCNKAISVLESSTYTWRDENIKNRSKGEAYFLRALYYFNLVRQYGGVPLVITPVTGKEAVEIKRSSEDEVYQLIISDLNNAQDYLSKAATVEEKGRANQSAALGILGKVYLTRKDYSAASQVLKKVIDLKKFSLLLNYADLFDPNAKDYTETIFSVQYSESSSELANDFIFFNVPNTSKGEVTNRPNISLRIAGSMEPSIELINAFEADDSRKNVAIQYWTGAGWDGIEKSFPYCAKYKPPQISPLNYCGDNFPVLRYADILLMYGECLNNLGSTSEAAQYIFSVRKRAGLTNDISQLSQAELDSLIEKERQVEFCFENQRWYDLVRRGTALDVMNAQGKEIDAYKILQPIPGEEVFINKLEQNPGY
ncbi:RagB/SusD family nutrient uptake outer membrane protein [Agriterribacter sp.]|uniref:RagB/SusD family nutrient uptake outer membrane protein n=1 Tax=Agriterribacter sp. TaxID=2821509 RepID=UPI002C6DE032|nr:RagB/SusD family nutrient uptake outer membrane protein [Agriterribacter sp.]HRP54534.1 RagB/SusD family nutrient uptake outer membrane protein [Agriterribacter sp.]